MKLEIHSEKFNDVLISHGVNFEDERGAFKKVIFGDELMNLMGSIYELMTVKSKKNVIRGLHFQVGESSQSKLLRVLKGKIQDVFIDLRKNSNTFEQCGYENMSPETGWIYIPKGFAHGYFAVEKTKMIYLLSDYRSKKDECGIDFRDKKLRIKLNNKILLSKKDLSNMTISEFENKIKTL